MCRHLITLVCHSSLKWFIGQQRDHKIIVIENYQGLGRNICVIISCRHFSLNDIFLTERRPKHRNMARIKSQNYMMEGKIRNTGHNQYCITLFDVTYSY